MSLRLGYYNFCRLFILPNKSFNQRSLSTTTINYNDQHIIHSFKPWSDNFSETELREVKKGDSSVIVPLVELNNEPWLIFTHRSCKLRTHRGEISFPGGKIDSGETIEQAAIREAEEEIGLKSDDIQIWGRIPPMRTRNDKNIITPVVAKVDEAALERLKICSDEVQSIFIAPLADFTDSKYTGFRVGKDVYKMHVYFTKKYRLLQKGKDSYENPDRVYKIWGLTGGILNELLTSTMIQLDSIEFD